MVQSISIQLPYEWIGDHSRIIPELGIQSLHSNLPPGPYTTGNIPSQQKNGASKKRWRRRWPTGPARLPSVRDMRRSEGPAMFAKSDNQAVKVGLLPTGKHTKNYGKCPFIVDLPIENGDVP